MKVVCWHEWAGGGIDYGPKKKMLCQSNKKKIKEIKFSSTNFLKMIITWAIFAAFIWICAAASASFCFFFVNQKKHSSHLTEIIV